MQMSKEKVRCHVLVPPWRVEGDVYVVSDSRLTDTLNAKQDAFFAVTDAVVFDLASGAELYRPDYLALNRTSVAAVFPVE
jgi:hypothetical protein